MMKSEDVLAISKGVLMNFSTAWKHPIQPVLTIVKVASLELLILCTSPPLPAFVAQPFSRRHIMPLSFCMFARLVRGVSRVS